MSDELYPFLADHKHSHKELIKKVQELADDYRVGDLALATPLIKFMVSLIKGHIKSDDFKFFSWLKNR